jgi:hypothetical protein
VLAVRRWDVAIPIATPAVELRSPWGSRLASQGLCGLPEGIQNALGQPSGILAHGRIIARLSGFFMTQGCMLIISWLTLQKQPIQAYVLTLFLTLCIIWARPVLIPARRGRAREASQMWGGERSCSRPRTPVGGRPLAALCWSKSKRLTVPRAKRRPALPFHHTHRAGLPSHPRSTFRLAAQAAGHKVLAL